MVDTLTSDFTEVEELPVEQKKYTTEQVLKAVAYTIASRPQVDCKLRHTFTKGLYCREIFMPAGTEVMSFCHKTQHQYVALIGATLVWKHDTGWEAVQAPERGITEPGTQRVLRTITDCVWLTFHPTDFFPINNSDEEILKAVALVEQDILVLDFNPFINSSEAREIPWHML